MTDERESILRHHLIELLKGGGAHATFEDAIANLPVELRGKRADNLPHSPWMLLEHLRLAQWDILEFSLHAQHISPEWPKGYWPESEAAPSAKAWDESVKKFRHDLQGMHDLVNDPKTDLFAKLPWGGGQTILREALLVADHNAYHVAQLVDLRRALGAWPEK